MLMGDEEPRSIAVEKPRSKDRSATAIQFSGVHPQTLTGQGRPINMGLYDKLSQKPEWATA
jgi:hypothetical protein